MCVRARRLALRDTEHSPQHAQPSRKWTIRTLGNGVVKQCYPGPQDKVYFLKGACQEELVMQGRGKDAQVWLASFDAVTPCTVQEVGFYSTGPPT